MNFVKKIVKPIVRLNKIRFVSSKSIKEINKENKENMFGMSKERYMEIMRSGKPSDLTQHSVEITQEQIDKLRKTIKANRVHSVYG